MPPVAGAAANQHLAKAEPIAPAKPAASHQAQAHVVAPGETLSSIARHYNMPVKELVAANRLTYDTHLKIGDRLAIPGAAVAKTTTAPKPAAVAAAAPAPRGRARTGARRQSEGREH